MIVPHGKTYRAKIRYREDAEFEDIDVAECLPITRFCTKEDYEKALLGDFSCAVALGDARFEDAPFELVWIINQRLPEKLPLPT